MSASRRERSLPRPLACIAVLAPWAHIPAAGVPSDRSRPADFARVLLGRWAWSRRLIISTHRVVHGDVPRVALHGHGDERFCFEDEVPKVSS
jgi:hypothetical protein